MTVNKLRLERLKRGLTQEDVYLLSQRRLHPSRLSRIERGVIVFTPEDLQLLAAALDIPMEELERLL